MNHTNEPTFFHCGVDKVTVLLGCNAVSNPRRINTSSPHPWSLVTQNFIASKVQTNIKKNTHRELWQIYTQDCGWYIYIYVCMYIPGRPLSSCPWPDTSGSGSTDICCAGVYRLYSSCPLGMHMTGPCVQFSWKNPCILHSWKNSTDINDMQLSKKFSAYHEAWKLSYSKQPTSEPSF